MAAQRRRMVTPIPGIGPKTCHFYPSNSLHWKIERSKANNATTTVAFRVFAIAS
jgi:hypothetical protein